MTDVMKQYLDLVRHVLSTGTRKENRMGTDSLSTFGYYYEHDLCNGFPLLTTKKINWKNIVIELLWFLSGSNRSGFLDRHGCGFWKPWYNKPGPFLENPNDGAVVNAAYGPAWRRFEYPIHCDPDSWESCDDTPYLGHFDQVEWVVDRLKSYPMSRDMVVSAWQPHIATRPPSNNTYWAPCHCMWILNVQNKSTPDDTGRRLCLHLTQRSGDVAIGVPYNIASYALLCSILARLAGMEPGIFGHTLVDAHIYTAKPDGSQAEFDHVPGLMRQLDREPRSLPILHIDDSIRTLEDVETLLHPSVTTDEIMSKFVLEGYDPWPAISFRVAV